MGARSLAPHAHTPLRTRAAPVMQGCTLPEVLAVIDKKELRGPMELLPELDTADCPRRVFEWVQEPLA